MLTPQIPFVGLVPLYVPPVGVWTEIDSEGTKLNAGRQLRKLARLFCTRDFNLNHK